MVVSKNLDLYRFFVGWFRYSGASDKPWVACAIYSDGNVDAEVMADKFYDLDAGDTDASWALDYIMANADCYAWGETPAIAMQAVEAMVTEKLN